MLLKFLQLIRITNFIDFLFNFFFNLIIFPTGFGVAHSNCQKREAQLESAEQHLHDSAQPPRRAGDDGCSAAGR
jgi:hypothetical protein